MTVFVRLQTNNYIKVPGRVDRIRIIMHKKLGIAIVYIQSANNMVFNTHTGLVDLNIPGFSEEQVPIILCIVDPSPAIKRLLSSCRLPPESI